MTTYQWNLHYDDLEYIQYYTVKVQGDTLLRLIGHQLMGKDRASSVLSDSINLFDLHDLLV